MVNDKKLDTSNASPDGPKPCPLGDACESAIYLREYMRVDAEHAAEKARRASGSARAECYACHWVESQDFARARVHTYRAGCCMVDAQGMRSSAASTDDAAYARRMADERNEWESRYRELAAEVLGYAIDQGIPSTDARSAVECIRQLRAALNKGKADPSHLIEMARGLHDAFLLVGIEDDYFIKRAAQSGGGMKIWVSSGG